MLFAIPLFAQNYDLVIANGRVLDPATNLDAVRNIGIRGGKIAAVSTSPLAPSTARATIDAKGLVVSPGFIDLHSHGQTPENYRLKARDGVTTALELEVGVHPVAAWYAHREGARPDQLRRLPAATFPARIAVMHDSGTLLPRDRAVERAATPAEFRDDPGPAWAAASTKAPQASASASPTCRYESRAEVLGLFRLAAARKVPLFVHMRNGGPLEPGVIDALQEVIADAAVDRRFRPRGAHHQHGLARNARSAWR